MVDASEVKYPKTVTVFFKGQTFVLPRVKDNPGFYTNGFLKATATATNGGGFEVSAPTEVLDQDFPDVITLMVEGVEKTFNWHAGTKKVPNSRKDDARLGIFRRKKKQISITISKKVVHVGEIEEAQ